MVKVMLVVVAEVMGDVVASAGTRRNKIMSEGRWRPLEEQKLIRDYVKARSGS